MKKHLWGKALSIVVLSWVVGIWDVRAQVQGQDPVQSTEVDEWHPEGEIEPEIEPALAVTEQIPALEDVQDIGVLEYRDARNPETVAGRIRLTRDDVLWMARMLRGEAYGFGRRHYAMVLYTVAQRLWYLPTYRTLTNYTEFMRRFSQPINPRFTDPSSLYCRRYHRACTPAHIARRQKMQSMPWEQIPDELREMAILFAQGKLENPVPLSIDFARAYGPRDCVNKGTRVLTHDPVGVEPNHVFCRPQRDEQAPLLAIVPQAPTEWLTPIQRPAQPEFWETQFLEFRFPTIVGL
jgi:hypothetical protein